MYTFKEQQGVFHIYSNNQPVLTPGGQEVVTEFKDLAKRLVKDLEKYGNDPSNSLSIVAFHYPYLDFHKINLDSFSFDSVALGLEPEWEWTFDCPTAEPEGMMRWISLFGIRSEIYDKAKTWVYSLSPMQLSAVTVLGRTLQSINIPYLIVNVLDKSTINAYAKEIWDIESESFAFNNVIELRKVFQNYCFYYNLDNKKDAIR